LSERSLVGSVVTLDERSPILHVCGRGSFHVIR